MQAVSRYPAMKTCTIHTSDRLRLKYPNCEVREYVLMCTYGLTTTFHGIDCLYLKSKACHPMPVLHEASCSSRTAGTRFARSWNSCAFRVYIASSRSVR
jgi:hypothetical protein